MATHIPRVAYATMFGPTTGDRLRLADTALVIEVEADSTVYGEEVKFGGGKVIRDGMGQSQRSRADGAAGVRHLRLPHAVADHLTATEFHLLAVRGEVLLNLDDEIGIGEADLVAGGRPEHAGVGGA